jgi:hypothetical protein
MAAATVQQDPFIPYYGKTLGMCSMQELLKIEELKLPKEATEEMIRTAGIVVNAMHKHHFINTDVKGNLEDVCSRFVFNAQNGFKSRVAEVDGNCSNLALYTTVSKEVIESYARLSGFSLEWHDEKHCNVVEAEYDAALEAQYQQARIPAKK